jgi:hypothetical protein
VFLALIVDFLAPWPTLELWRDNNLFLILISDLPETSISLIRVK